MYQKTLKKMLAFMEGTGYTGPLDINCIVSERDGEAYGLEFCPRWGYSAIYAALKCLDMPLGKFLADLAEGTLKEIPWKPGFGGSVRMSVPPYPFDTIDKKLKEKLYYDETYGLEVGCDMENDHYVPLDIMKGTPYPEDKKYIVAGTDGVIMEVTGYGNTIEELARDIYPMCDKVRLADNYVRTDMIRNAKPRWDKLVKMGYLRGINNGISA
jgi:phosphoribosylamine-glycine ligase